MCQRFKLICEALLSVVAINSFAFAQSSTSRNSNAFSAYDGLIKTTVGSRRLCKGMGDSPVSLRPHHCARDSLYINFCMLVGSRGRTVADAQSLWRSTIGSGQAHNHNKWIRATLRLDDLATLNALMLNSEGSIDTWAEVMFCRQVGAMVICICLTRVVRIVKTAYEWNKWNMHLSIVVTIKLLNILSVFQGNIMEIFEKSHLHNL